MTSFEEFLDKISPLRTANKLGAILFQSLQALLLVILRTLNNFSIYCPPLIVTHYAVQFRHPSWGTVIPCEMLKHYNIAAVTTDSPPSENLQYLSDVIVTADHSLVRFHGRNTKGHYWYNDLYSEQELKPWMEKVDQIRKQTKILRVYFNNHYGGKAVVNALQFKAMTGHPLSGIETNALESAEKYLSNQGLITSSSVD